MNNWFGLTIHPTDAFINWRDKTPEETAKKLRAAYDRLITGPQERDDFELLIDAAHDKTRQDCWDDEADNAL